MDHCIPRFCLGGLGQRGRSSLLACACAASPLLAVRCGSGAACLLNA